MADDLIMPRMAWYKRKWIWILLFLVLAGGGGAAWWWLQPAEAPLSEQEVQDNKALYVGMSRPFIFSVPGGVRDRLVQIEVQLLVRGTADEGLAKQHLPLLESTLLTVFSRQTADNYLTADGKDAVRREALDELNHVMVEVLGQRLVEKVLFTGIVMQ